jgi:hypothetical protein
VTQWISEHLVRAVPNPPGTLLTELGTIVVAGSGYPGTGPDTHISVGHGHYQWAFVSPIPQIRLGEITYNQTDEDVVAIDRAANDRTIRASRFASVTFSPCFRAAVLANLTTAHSVPGS